jgi:hypothetical protein
MRRKRVTAMIMATGINASGAMADGALGRTTQL